MNFAITTYSFNFFGVENPQRGDTIKKDGYTGEGRILADDEETIVVAWKGYGENPGSRNSMLYSYYPATTEVFVYDHTDDHGRRRYRSLIEWQSRAPKKV